MKVMGFFVWVRVPNEMNPAKVGEELRISIGFGQPQVTPLFQFPEPEQVIKIMPNHEEPLAHDGYATHTHEVRPDHLGVHRKEWGHNV